MYLVIARESSVNFGPMQPENCVKSRQFAQYATPAVTFRLRNSRIVSIGLAVLVTTLVCSCGFHPRGSVTRLTELGSIYVDAAQGLGIAEPVRDALLDAAFTLAANRDEADILLRLTQESQNERVVSVKSNGRVSELELSHAISMLIAQAVGDAPPVYQPGQTLNRIEVNREYTSDETGVLGKENEARILREEMEVELVRQIVLRTIASLSPSISSSSVDLSKRLFATLHLPDTGQDLSD